MPKYYHITDTFLGDSCFLHPDIPGAPYEDGRGWIIEDFTTPRVSFAQDALQALQALSGKSAERFFVYGANKLNGFHNPSRAKCPSSPKNPYGEHFKWQKYAKYKGISANPSDFDVDQIGKIVRGCVPDAKITGEVWATKPTKVNLVGGLVYIGERFGRTPESDLSNWVWVDPEAEEFSELTSECRI